MARTFIPFQNDFIGGKEIILKRRPAVLCSSSLDLSMLQKQDETITPVLGLPRLCSDSILQKGAVIKPTFRKMASCPLLCKPVTRTDSHLSLAETVCVWASISHPSAFLCKVRLNHKRHYGFCLRNGTISHLTWPQNTRGASQFLVNNNKGVSANNWSILVQVSFMRHLSRSSILLWDIVSLFSSISKSLSIFPSGLSPFSRCMIMRWVLNTHI